VRHFVTHIIPATFCHATFFTAAFCRASLHRCTDFLNIFAEKFGEKIGVFLHKTKQNLKKLIITLVFEKNANFFAEDWQKTQKIVIINNIDP
jgi:hypothetical protein